MKGGTRQIYFKIESVESDPNQYKPTKPKMCPKELWLVIDVPEKYFTSGKGLPKTAQVLTLAGFNKVSKVLLGLERFE
jgi:hypothetical protein